MVYSASWPAVAFFCCACQQVELPFHCFMSLPAFLTMRVGGETVAEGYFQHCSTSELSTCLQRLSSLARPTSCDEVEEQMKVYSNCYSSKNCCRRMWREDDDEIFRRLRSEELAECPMPVVQCDIENLHCELDPHVSGFRFRNSVSDACISSTCMNWLADARSLSPLQTTISALSHELNNYLVNSTTNPEPR